jgi:hypothetical protein
LRYALGGEFHFLSFIYLVQYTLVVELQVEELLFQGFVALTLLVYLLLQLRTCSLQVVQLLPQLLLLISLKYVLLILLILYVINHGFRDSLHSTNLIT